MSVFRMILGVYDVSAGRGGTSVQVGVVTSDPPRKNDLNLQRRRAATSWNDRHLKQLSGVLNWNFTPKFQIIYLMFFLY